MWWYIIGMLGFALWLIGKSRSEREAIARRRERLTSRMPSTLDDWHAAVPSVSVETLAAVLPLIEDGLSVPQAYLYPTDSFDGELSVKDRFWCLVADDDSRDSIADQFEDRFNHRPSGDWQDLRDVVVEAQAYIDSSAVSCE